MVRRRLVRVSRAREMRRIRAGKRDKRKKGEGIKSKK
jgi:hypothetical protein